MVDADAILDQEPGALDVTADGSPVHEREVVGPADMGLQHRDARSVRRAGIEHGLKGVVHASPRRLMQDVVGGLVDLQRHLVVEEECDGRAAPLHAYDHLEQVLAYTVQHFRVIGQNLRHSTYIGSTLPPFRGRPHRRRDELPFGVGKVGYLDISQRPVSRE